MIMGKHFGKFVNMGTHFQKIFYASKNTFLQICYECGPVSYFLSEACIVAIYFSKSTLFILPFFSETTRRPRGGLFWKQSNKSQFHAYR